MWNNSIVIGLKSEKKSYWDNWRSRWNESSGKNVKAITELFSFSVLSPMSCQSCSSYCCSEGGWGSEGERERDGLRQVRQCCPIVHIKHAIIKCSVQKLGLTLLLCPRKPPSFYCPCQGIVTIQTASCWKHNGPVPNQLSGALLIILLS